MSLQIFYNRKSVIYTHIVLPMEGVAWKWWCCKVGRGGGSLLKEISRMQRQPQSALGKYERMLLPVVRRSCGPEAPTTLWKTAAPLRPFLPQTINCLIEATKCKILMNWLQFYLLLLVLFAAWHSEYSECCTVRKYWNPALILWATTTRVWLAILILFSICIRMRVLFTLHKPWLFIPPTPSNTYFQSSPASSQWSAVPPTNDLFWAKQNDVPKAIPLWWPAKCWQIAKAQLILALSIVWRKCQCQCQYQYRRPEQQDKKQESNANWISAENEQTCDIIWMVN